MADPACPPDGAVVRVGACGVCRSDWHAWTGHDPTVALPYVPGHEWAGTLVELGPEVRGWQVGERVTAPFVQACGRCTACSEGAHQVCRRQRQPGFTEDGAFAELVVVHRAEINLVVLPDDLDFVTAAGLGCRFATAYGAVAGHGGIRPGWWVAVLGCGGVGLSAVMIATALGARVLAVDPSAVALQAAADLGATTYACAGAGPAEIGREIREITGGGAHVSLDAYGDAETCRASITGLRPRGRHVQVGLLAGDEGQVCLPVGRVLADELSIVGSHGLAAHEYAAMLQLVTESSIDLRQLVGRRISLTEAPAALTGMDQPQTRAGMQVIDLSLAAP